MAHLAFRYIKGRKKAFALYNGLIKAGKEALLSYDPNTNRYYVRFWE